MLIAICDDDSNQLIEIKNKCEQSFSALGITQLNIIHTYRQCIDLINAIEIDHELYYDIIIMDIEFGADSMSGLEAIQILRKMQIDSQIIISTFYDSYLKKGYGLGIIRYISKPINQDELSEALIASVSRINQIGGKEILLKNETESVLVKYKDIIYIECFDHNICVHVKDQKNYFCSQTIDSIEKQIPSLFFIRIHKGIIINFNYVKSISYSELTLDDKTKLPIARRRRSEFISALHKFIREST